MLWQCWAWQISMITLRPLMNMYLATANHSNQVYGKCSFQHIPLPNIIPSPFPSTSSVHLKPYPIDTLSPCPSLKVLSHWQPINSQTLRPVHSRIQNISLPNIILSPFPSLKFLSQQQPTNVLFQWLESDMEEGMWVLFVTDDAVNTARI